MRLEVKGSYLFKDNQPFFWLGDTAWLLFEKLTVKEAKQYLEIRKSQGFTGIQCVLLHTYENGFSCAGKSPKDEKYWKEVLEVVSYAKTLDLVLGILPAWGAMVKNGILSMDNIDSYADFLIQTFFEFDHIIWILGGDIRGDAFYEFYNYFGKKLKAGNPERLITFHPFGRTASYQWFKDCSWLDFHMFQSGHRRYDQIVMNAWDDKQGKEDTFGEDNYKYIKKNRSILPFKPCLDGEPSYEGIPQGLHDFTQPYWQSADIRRYAYWSVLAGACGFTYGNNSVMQFFRFGDVPSYGVKEEWMEGLYMPGAQQMHILKDLMLRLDFVNGRSRDELVLEDKPFYEHIACFGGDTYLLCYTYLGKSFSLNLEEFSTLEGYWLNPEIGTLLSIGSILPTKITKFKPSKRKSLSQDWVLILVVPNEKFNLM